MTNMPMDIVEELSSMEELIDQADRRRQAERDMSVPVGAELGRTDLGGGGSIIQTKQNALVQTANGTALPGRTPVYYRLQSNQVRWVDTGRLAHHLSKRVAGERVFSLKPWPDAGEAEVYERTCEICLAGPYHIRKRFVVDEYGDGETKYIAHQRTFHGDQWETSLRRIERDERREEQALLREMLATIAGMNKPAESVAPDIEKMVADRLAALMAEMAEATQAEPDLEPAPPPVLLTETCDCGDVFKATTPGGLANKLRMHRLGKKHRVAAEV